MPITRNSNKALRYSLSDEITLTDIREGKFFDIDTDSLSFWMQDNHINAIVDGDDNFHYKFHLIKSKPYIIYYAGNLSLLDKNILGIVGPRKKTFYSDKVVSKLLETATHYDLVTISGMAEGVDQLCHSISIKNNIPTIAVLGGGIRRYLNRSERNIISCILDHGGLVISEFKLDFQPTNYSFPQRNRIIAGLSDVLFLPQAGLKSGSLITVDFAISMSKPVCGVADNIFSSQSAGINQYISDKKISLVSDFDKFLSKYFSSYSQLPVTNKPITSITLSENEKKILNIISDRGEISIDQICVLVDIPSQQLFSSLTLLEINSLIYQSVPGFYKLN